MLRDAVVLIADDSPTVREMLHALFTSRFECAEVKAVATGEEALEYAKQAQRVDWILSDWQMPGMSGERLLREIRSNESTRETPFIMITARSDGEAIRQAIQAGVSDFLVKPFDVEQLLEKIHKINEKRRKPGGTR